VTIFGLSLENGKNGIFYHAIGVNGAKYSHYNAAQFFAAQTAVLRPELFIISMGTNEAIDYPYIDKNFYQHIDKLITSLRSSNPDAKFILVTPPDAYRKKMKHNPGVNIVRQQIIQYAVENGLAFYDMYKAMGGDHAADKWTKSRLLRSDGIHFTKDGYEYQGNLLFNAIIKSYNLYVPLRHP
jgi:lysophospholipase L1-like esterase